MGNASVIRLSPGVAGLEGLLSTWSNSTRVVTPGLKPKMACCDSGIMGMGGATVRPHKKVTARHFQAFGAMPTKYL